MSDLISSVSNLIREAAQIYVMPVFHLLDKNTEEKTPGEWVTKADRDSEAFLGPALRSLIPGSLVVGEESVSSYPATLDSINDEGFVWVIDPLDGTANFANGESPFAIMVALLQNGETVASWIFDPLADQLSVSEKHSGSWINDQKVLVDEDVPDVNSITGAVLHRFLPPELSAHVLAVEHQFARLTLGSGCAGYEYPEIVKKSIDFALYWRTLPWDHLPGVLFLQEAGGFVARPDGSKYSAKDHSRSGLLVARNEGIWNSVKSSLIL